MSSERETTGLLHPPPLSLSSGEGLQLVPHHHRISPFLALSPMSHCTTPLIRTMHCLRKNNRRTETGRYRYPRDKSVRRYRWTSHTLFPRILSRLAFSRPSPTARLTHLVVCVPGCLRVMSLMSVLRHWMTTVRLPSRRRSLALDWSPILSIVLMVMSLCVPSPRPPTADDVCRYLRATALRTRPSPISWPYH